MVHLTQAAEVFPVVLGLVVRGAILLALAGVVAFAVRRASAAARHLVWVAAMVGLLVLPVAGVVAPELRVPVPARLLPASQATGVAVGAVPREVTPWEEANSVLPSNEAVPRVAAERPVGSGEGGLSGTAAATYRVGDEGAESPAAKPDAPDEVGAPPANGRAAGGAAPGVPLAVWLTAVWVLGALVLLARVAGGLAAIRRLGGRLPQLEAPRIVHRANRLASRVGVRSFRLLEGDGDAMPMTFGTREPAIVLPSTARTWSAERLDAVLLHELAHISRRDILSQLAAEVARAIHWVNPLAWLAIRRLEAEREHACDDVALAQGARASSYAAELLGLAQRYRAGTARRAALAMARPGPLSRRLRAVLDDGRRRSELARGLAWKAAALAAVVVVPLAALVPDGAEAAPMEPDGAGPASAEEEAPPFDVTPGVAVQDPTCIAGRGEWDSIQSRSNNGRRTVVLERPGCQLEVRFEGDIEFDAAGTGIARMSQDARLTVEEDDGRMTRSLEVVPGAGGRPAFDYRENRNRQEFDAGARQWYQAVMLGLSRATGFLAEARVQAMLDQGGVESVLQELGQLHTDLAYARHVEALLQRADLDEAETRALIRGSADRVDSDHYLAGILQAVAEHQQMTGGTLDDFVRATARLDSDHYRTQALSTALTSGRLSDDQVAMVIQAAGEMDSDHYRTEILVAVADRYALEPGFRQLYLQSTAAMDSDHYRTQVLNRLLDRNDLSADEKAAVLESATMLESDHYRTELLSNVAQQGLGEPALHEAFFRVAAGLESDHYYREAMGLLIREPVSDEMLVTVLEAAARQLDSDHYKADLLLAVLEGRSLDGRVREAFLGAMDSLGSEHYRGQVASALLQAEAR